MTVRTPESMSIQAAASAIRISDARHSATSDADDGLLRTIAAMLAYGERHQWAGADPYDALNSPLFDRTPLGSSRICRLIAIQALKRSPLNLRPLLAIRPAQNPKALALVVTALVKLAQCGQRGDPAMRTALADRLAALRSPATDHWCWGYSFPWQTRRELVPRFAPNLVCTTFVGNALLDLYDLEGDPRHLAMAASAAEYLTRDLFWCDAKGAAGFSYPSRPAHTRVHNANLLGAAFLWRTCTHHGDKRFADAAHAATRYAVSEQRSDGSWPYGESSTQAWIDNFHTGFNLCALEAIGRYTGTSQYEPALRRGFEFYRRRFFNPDGSPAYFHDRPYPIDAHCVAQSLITLVRLRDRAPESTRLAESAYAWAMEHMWNPDGYFYYRVNRLTTNRMSFMRWSHAWMTLALVMLRADRQDRAVRAVPGRSPGARTAASTLSVVS